MSNTTGVAMIGAALGGLGGVLPQRKQHAGREHDRTEQSVVFL